MATNNVHMKFKIEIPKQTRVTLRKPCQLQSSDTEQGKSEGFDSCDRPSNLAQFGFKSSIFQPVWNLMDDPEKQSGYF